MLDSFLIVFEQMFRIFLLIGVGYALNRLRLLVLVSAALSYALTVGG